MVVVWTPDTLTVALSPDVKCKSPVNNSFAKWWIVIEIKYKINKFDVGVAEIKVYVDLCEKWYRLP